MQDFKFITYVHNNTSSLLKNKSKKKKIDFKYITYRHLRMGVKWRQEGGAAIRLALGIMVRWSHEG